ncbi:AGK_G0052980.mRNA.1.CDS.1 [Saccharomyces cerevisiae]|nr:AGK_G0052980.mRNA.1.CDS.1 [Saccharomyces cerevisiae]CAI5335701.1 BBF_HP2_G0051730.mRNA.1.CDS.1 [Saccharomyces cerevisiae]CAI6796367.1 BBF_HP2_G0051730.mRNA.1.CDS.1 [Saccharomyces cerevisiae]CAI6810659.1 BBF_HP1_G0053320.mRNA.1.CDS.1 [Saccharomyces cerevisiae]CAI6899404.1 AGK_G0052980.mRNA.1.CDS.1 [Saccharomyces cerevisiae]
MYFTDESSPAMNRVGKKRNRLSFVCQACRKAKTKCDQEKPRCGRCTKQNLFCIYDVARQAAPRNPNKDATIARLKKEIRYWRNKTVDLTQEKKDFYTALKRPTKELAARRTCKSLQENSFPISLYKTHPRLIMTKVMKREINPLSEKYLIFQDTFLKTLIASVLLSSSRNSMIPALNADISRSRTQPCVKNNVVKMREVLLKNSKYESQRKSINEFTDRLLQRKNPEEQIAVNKVISLLYSNRESSYLEDTCPTENDYSDLLKGYINEIEKTLPPKAIIEQYLSHFFEHIFHLIPFASKEMLEESIHTTVQYNELGEVRLSMGTTLIRNKMENLCILLLILRIAYISLTFIEDKIEDYSPYITKEMLEQYPIQSEVIFLAQQILASENWCACANENTISCLLYIWCAFVFSPTEGDFLLEQPSDVIINLVILIGTSIGLHRDPSDFPALNHPEASDKRLLNLRRIQWLSIISMATLESSLKGRLLVSPLSMIDLFIDVRDPNCVEIYKKRVKKDLTGSESDEQLLEIHEIFFHRAQLALFLSDLNNITISYSGSVPMDTLETLRVKANELLKDKFQLRSVDINIYDEEKTFQKLTFNSILNSISLSGQILGKLMMLRASIALMLYFETLAMERSECLSFFYKYFFQCCADTISLIRFFFLYFNGSYEKVLSSLVCFITTKVIQLAVPTTMFTLLVIIMRVELAKNMLLVKCNECNARGDISDLPEIKEKIKSLDTIKENFERLLLEVYLLASQNLRFKYFYIFKMLTLFDVFIQRLRKGQLFSGLFVKVDKDLTTKKIATMLELTLGINLDKSDHLIDRLKGKNLTVNFTLDQLHQIIKEFDRIKNIGVADPQNSLNPSKPNMKDNTPTIELLLNSSVENESVPPYSSSNDPTNVGNASTYNLAHNISNQNNEENMPPSIGSSESNRAAPNLNFMPVNNNYNNSGSNINNNDNVKLPSNFKNYYDPPMSSLDISMDVPDIFGSLDFFDYDLLFQND